MVQQLDMVRHPGAADTAAADAHDEAGRARLRAAISSYRGYGYTLHLDFSAADDWSARVVAMTLAKAL